MLPHYLSEVIDQLLPVYYLVVVELAEEPAPAHASLRVHLSQTSVDGAEGQLVDHSAQFLVVEVLDQTGIVVRVEEVLLVDACSHKLQHPLRLILPRRHPPPRLPPRLAHPLPRGQGGIPRPTI